MVTKKINHIPITRARTAGAFVLAYVHGQYKNVETLNEEAKRNGCDACLLKT